MSSVDIIVPCYNYGHLLEACVESILSQRGVTVRVIVMDDASTDDTPAIGYALAARSPRVEYRRHAVNRGHIATYNEALETVTADYCMILSADDLLTPGSLARATRLMDSHPEVGLTYGRDITFRHVPPVDAARDATLCGRLILGYVEFLETSCRLGHTPIQAPSALVRTALHRKIGAYRPELPHTADTEIWLRMAANAAVGQLDADQAFRRLHTANMSLSFPALRRLEEQKKAFDVHFDECGRAQPETAKLEPLMQRTIGEAAFWLGVRAFERGNVHACEEALAFAASTCPDLRTGQAWRRFHWKRRLGTSVWRYLEPAAACIRQVKMYARTGSVPSGRSDPAVE